MASLFGACFSLLLACRAFAVQVNGNLSVPLAELGADFGGTASQHTTGTSSTSTTTLMTTGCNVVRFKDIEYLDRHDVACPAGTSLTSFSMLPPGPPNCGHSDDARIVFSCTETSGANTTRYTPCDEIQGTDAEHLDRHNVSCESGEALAGFEMTNADTEGCTGSQRRFKYTCVQAGLSAATANTTGCDLLRGQKLEYLDRHSVFCQQGGILTSFRVTQGSCSGDNMLIEYGCATVLETVPETVVSGTGDPHLSNIHGEHFDVYQPGILTLLQLPRLAKPAGTALRVEADARRMVDECSVYFQVVTISGTWTNQSEPIQFLANAHGTPRGMRWNQWVRFGTADLKVTRHIKGVEYLNVYAKNVDRAGLPVGGLLGIDDHTAAATRPPQCTKRRYAQLLESSSAAAQL